MHHVFVSYSRDDTRAVDRLAAVLEAAEVPIWLDRRDIPVSVPWFEEVTAAIDAADLVVVCDSPNWRRSKACLLERHVAERSHKRIVPVDIVGSAPRAAANKILGEYRTDTEALRAHTELCVRGAIWERHGRSSRDLISGALLRRAKEIRRRGTPPLTPTATELVVASRQRQRRRRWLLSTGTTIAVIALLATVVAAPLPSTYEDQQRQTAADLATFVAAQEDVDPDPYQALTLARDRVRDGHTGFLDRVRITNALDVTVPDASYTTDVGRLIGFVAPASGSATVMGASGGRHSGPGRPSQPPPRRPRDGPVRAAAAGIDGTTVAWSTRSATTVTINGKTLAARPPADRLAVSPKGTTLLMAGDHRAWMERLPSGPAAATGLPRSCCTSAAIAGGTGIVGTREGELVAVRAGQRARVAWRRRPGGAVTVVAAAPDGRRIAVALERDGVVRVLTVPGFVQQRALVAPGRAAAIAFSPNGRLVAVAVAADVMIFDVGTGMRLAALAGSVGPVRQLAWSGAGDRVFAIAGDDRVSSWPLRAGRVLVDDPSRQFVAAVGPAEDGTLAAVERNGRVSIIDPEKLSVARVVRTSARGVVSADLTRDAKTLALGTPRAILLHDIAGGAERRIPLDCVTGGVAFGPADDRLYATCLDRGIRLYHPRDGRLLARAPLTGRSPFPIAVAATGEVFVGDLYGEIHHFDGLLRDGSRVVEGQCMLPARTVAVSDSGGTVVFSGDGAVHLSCMYEAHRRDGRWERVFHQQPLGLGEQGRAVAITPDGTVAAVGLSDGTIRFWHPGSLDPGGSYHEFGGEVRGAAFTADGAHLVVATLDGFVEALPSCPLCGSMEDLATMATDTLSRAERIGLAG